MFRKVMQHPFSGQRHVRPESPATPPAIPSAPATSVPARCRFCTGPEKTPRPCSPGCAATAGRARSSVRTARASRRCWRNSFRPSSGPATAPLWITLHDGQRRLPPEAKRELRLRPPTLLAIDGYEQLGRWSRFRLRRHCRRRKLGLLITAHNSAGLPESPPCRRRRRIVFQNRPATIGRPAVSVEQLRSGRAVRAPRRKSARALFELYDLYERQPTAKRQNLT